MQYVRRQISSAQNAISGRTPQAGFWRQMDKVLVNEIKYSKTSALITFEDGKVLRIDRNLVKAMHIRQGEALNIQQLYTQNEEYAYRFAMDSAMNYLSYAMRTQNELEEYLYRKNIQKGAVEKTMHKLLEYGYIGDERYAETFVQNRKLSASSKRAIRDKLRKKGIGEDIIDRSLLDYTDEEERSSAREFLIKQNGLLQKYPPKIRREKLCRKLIQKGYPAEILDEVWDTLDTGGNYDDFYIGLIEKKITAYSHKGYDKYTFKNKLYQALYPKGVPKEIIDEKFEAYICGIDNDY